MYAGEKRNGESEVVATLAEDTTVARGPAAPRHLEEHTDKAQPEPNEIEADAAAGQPAAGPAAPPAEKPARRAFLRPLLLVAAAAVLGVGGYYGHYWWTTGRFSVSTDDAYVRAANTTLAAKLSGYVADIRVADNQYVHAGDVIAVLDDGDYRLAADQARTKMQTQQVTVQRLGEQAVAQQATIEQTQAQLVSAQAGAKRADLELTRQQSLAARDYASKQTLEQSIANRDQANASVVSAQAAIDAANANLAVLKAQQREAEGTLNELKVALAKAERDLSFTTIRAPVDGVFGNRAVQAGDYVSPGQRIAALVPLENIYIDANFKETQLAGLRPGQKVDLTVDAVPDQTMHGTVVSLAPASGSVFTLLPPDNATGNFTKIVQRVPVRIAVPADIAAQRVLRPGMSVVVSINTKDAGTTTRNIPLARAPVPSTAAVN
ncbi:MAG: HlyD family secretion protein [Rhizobiales bacterium]|nr:HlyD family secretion protein [Hyphomicrobiales bacterium]